MTINVAFFLSDMGDLIHVADSHIATVIRDPEKFGRLPAEIETAFRKHGERLAVDGEARKELLLQVIRLGWVRIRRYRNSWSVTLSTLTTAVRGLIQDWPTQMLTGVNGFKEKDRYMPMKISTGARECLYSIGDLADGSCPR